VAYNYVVRALQAKIGAPAWMATHSGATHSRGAFHRSPVNGQRAPLHSADGKQDETTGAKRIGIIVFDHMTAADLMGPAEVFSRPTITTDDARQNHCYRVVTIGINLGTCATESGVTIRPQADIGHAPPLDTIVIPGGDGIHDPRLNKKIREWLNRRAPATRRIVALGKGIYVVAATGLLDGRQIVAHWSVAKDVASHFPTVRVNAGDLFVKDGPFYTCAGGISAVDLSLALIEEDYGRQIALKLARELVVPLKRSGGDEQYSEPLKFQVQSSDRLADLPAWILSHLNHDLSVDALAERVCTSRRNFTRLFNRIFGKSPSQFVAEARIAEAQQRLLVPRNSIESVANSLGFRSADVFSVAFERHVGIRPSVYRAHMRTPQIKTSVKRRIRNSIPGSFARVA
jgi:transcriptional regulator GlxA family with amidase domain